MADWFGGADKAKGYQMAMTVLAFIGMYVPVLLRHRARTYPPGGADE
ncbi:hypothetical protein [Klebsiella pneumoniae]|nr:hypothetical protein [Klebsiella pneumoniae]